MKLNLGCCDRMLSGWLNVDVWMPSNAGVEFRQADLTKPWPWPDNSIEEIRAWDIIEHLPDKIHTMNEAWRVLKPGGRLDIAVPSTDGRGAWQDPQHVSYWNRHSFWYFTFGDINRERFAAAYGITAKFRVVQEKQETRGGVAKLEILLEAVK